MTQRWDASTVPETLQRLGAQLTAPAYFAVPVAEPPPGLAWWWCTKRHT